MSALLTKPVWWDESTERDRRIAVVHAFRPGWLNNTIGDLYERLEARPTSIDQLACLVRRQRSAAWLAEVGLDALRSIVDDQECEQTWQGIRRTLLLIRMVELHLNRFDDLPIRRARSLATADPDEKGRTV